MIVVVKTIIIVCILVILACAILASDWRSKVRKEIITFTVDDKYGKVLYKELMPVNDALKAVKWLETHNGHAPEEVHSLIRGMRIAIRAAKNDNR